MQGEWVDREKTSGSTAGHESQTIESRAQAEPNMGIHQGPAVGRPVLPDVHMLGELRGGPFQIRAERQGGQAMG